MNALERGQMLNSLNREVGEVKSELTGLRGDVKKISDLLQSLPCDNHVNMINEASTATALNTSEMKTQKERIDKQGKRINKTIASGVTTVIGFTTALLVKFIYFKSGN